MFFLSSRRRHTRWPRDWSSDVCSSDLVRDEGCRVHPGIAGGGTYPVPPEVAFDHAPVEGDYRDAADERCEAIGDGLYVGWRLVLVGVADDYYGIGNEGCTVLVAVSQFLKHQACRFCPLGAGQGRHDERGGEGDHPLRS